MKKNLFKRGMAGLLSLVMCLTALVGIGTILPMPQEKEQRSTLFLFREAAMLILITAVLGGIPISGI